MNVPRIIVILALAAACGKREPIEVPANSSRLSVAMCPNSNHDDFTEYTTELTASGELRLWVDLELTKPFGATNTETVYGYRFTDTVWAVLVHDFNSEICEAYVADEAVAIVGVLDPETL